MKKILFFLLQSVLVVNLLSCADGFQAAYQDPDKVEIIDDKWNEADANKTSETMVKALLTKPWISDFEAKYKKKPILLIDEIQNDTSEHINTQALFDALTNELINSGKVRLVDPKNRKKILAEAKYQHNSGMVRKDQQLKLGRQIAPNYILKGTISSQVHTQGGVKTVSYKTFLMLTDLETSVEAFRATHDIKKKFKRSRAGW